MGLAARGQPSARRRVLQDCGAFAPESPFHLLQGLRNDGYVKIADSYREAVEPMLKIVPPAAATRRPAEKKKGRILGILPKP